MNGRCPQSTEVMEARSAGRLEDDTALVAHIGDCPICSRALAQATLGGPLLAALAEPFAPLAEEFEPLDEDTAAMIASGWMEPPPAGTYSPADEARLRRMMSTLEAAEAEGSGEDAAVDPAAAPERRGAEVVPLDRARRLRRRAAVTAGALVVAAAAMLALFVQPPNPTFTFVERPTLVERGSLAGLELVLDRRVCAPSNSPAATPCPWIATREPLTMHYWLEPQAKTRYLMVIARDAEGDLTVLYPPDAEQTPLSPTRGRTNDCRDGLCWLEGGRYEVPPGVLEVAAVFSVDPLPRGRLLADWAPEKWRATGIVDQFTLDVQKDAE